LCGDLIRALLYRLGPNRRWTPRHADAPIQAVDESNLRAMQLGDVMSGDLYQEAERTSGVSAPPEEQEHLGEKLSRLQKSRRIKPPCR